MKRDRINPLLLVAAKQPVGQDDADEIALPVLVHLDAAKRGQCTASGVNHLTLHLIIASALASKTRSKAFHDACTKAYSMLEKAARRPTDLLDLTTTEYQALRTAFNWYLRALPKVEVMTLNGACKIGYQFMAAEA